MAMSISTTSTSIKTNGERTINSKNDRHENKYNKISRFHGFPFHDGAYFLELQQ